MDIVIIILLILIINYLVTRIVSSNFDIASNYLWLLFAVHFLLTITYLISALYSFSDSVAYYNRSLEAGVWMDLWGTSTTFITFLGWIFSHWMGLSYTAIMLIFSYFGYLATVLLYVTAKENISIHPVWQSLTFVEIVFLLPNIHYWSSSLGKGSVILLGLGLFTFGLSRFNHRILPILAGGFLIYMVRPHIMLALALSIMLGIFFTRSGIKWYVRWMIFFIAVGVAYFISDSVVEFAETDSLNLNVVSSDALMHKVEELSRAGSGVDLQNYNIFMKLFTFWFRPLFFDGTSVVGIIASFENLFCLYMAIIIVREGLTNWRNWNGWFRICFFFFLLGSFILAQVSGNLGIAMRQKTQVMPFFFIIFCKALTYKQSVSESIIKVRKQAIISSK